MHAWDSAPLAAPRTARLLPKAAAEGELAAPDTAQGAKDWLRQRVGPQDALFLLHAALLVFGLGAVQPLSALLAYRAWRWFLFLSAITQAVKVPLSPWVSFVACIARVAKDMKQQQARIMTAPPHVLSCLAVPACCGRLLSPRDDAACPTVDG